MVVVVGFLGNSAAQIGLVREVRLGESWGPGLWMGVGDGLPEAEGWAPGGSPPGAGHLGNPKLPIPGALPPGPTTICHPARVEGIGCR